MLWPIFLLDCAVETLELRAEQLMKIKTQTLACYVYYVALWWKYFWEHDTKWVTFYNKL